MTPQIAALVGDHAIITRLARDGRLIAASTGRGHRPGASPSSVLSDWLRASGGPSRRWRVPEAAFHAVTSGGMWQGEVSLVCPDRARRWFRTTLVSDAPGTEIIAIQTDITARRRLAEMNRHFHSARAEVVLYDLDDATFVYLNQAASERLRLVPDGEDRWVARAGLGAHPLAAHLVQWAREMRDGGQTSARFEWQDGERMVEVLANLVELPDSCRAGFVLHDLRERHALERARSDLMSTITHELRTPLTSIKGTLTLLTHGVGGPLPDKARQMVALAERNTNRLSRLVNDILDWSKLRAGRMDFVFEPCDMIDLIGQAIEQDDAFADQSGIRLTNASANGAAGVLVCDCLRVLQVLSNLVSNAVKFSSEGGEVRLSARVEDDMAVLSVADDGPGIPSQFVNHLFDRFTQADSSDQRARGGTGLGLSIVKEIVDRHHGRIQLDNRPGEGATFHVHLPLAGPPDP
ncbi:sensor histidine kinase [Paracoccus zhouxuedongae]|uniref:sensor histidine kinase n=1 Tax=Paracoccus sp. p4-l81 TaxID=3342806 RepID=UPI0035BB9F85